MSRIVMVMVAVGYVLATVGSSTAPRPSVYRIDHVADGDTVTLGNGQRVRLVQIDTPEVYFGVECYGRRASAVTKGLLPLGTRVRLLPEPATDAQKTLPSEHFGQLAKRAARRQLTVSPRLGEHPGELAKRTARGSCPIPST
jgi:endonuclease YncB( thermonuclease family)